MGEEERKKERWREGRGSPPPPFQIPGSATGPNTGSSLFKDHKSLVNLCQGGYESIICIICSWVSRITLKVADGFS